ncbi:type II secretion system protein GspN [bacterium]|nr:type II secretion system protein GspN [bacterium]
MSRLGKTLVLMGVGLFSFILFLYWMFPYEVIKDKIEDQVEKQLGGAYEFKIESLSPSFVTGAVLRKVSLRKRVQSQLIPVFEAERLKARVSLFSVLFGSIKVKFYLVHKDGEIDVVYKETSGGAKISIEFDRFDLKNVQYFRTIYGLNLQGEIDGDIDLDLDFKRITASQGSIALKLTNTQIDPSMLRFGSDDTEGSLELPLLVINQKEEENIIFDINNGTIDIKEFAIGKKGDMGLTLGGKIYLAAFFKNYRMNLDGSLKFSEKVEKALPFLFIIQKQKDDKGDYPLRVTGRMSGPTIKIGTFTVPI